MNQLSEKTLELLKNNTKITIPSYDRTQASIGMLLVDLIWGK